MLVDIAEDGLVTAALGIERRVVLDDGRDALLAQGDAAERDPSRRWSCRMIPSNVGTPLREVRRSVPAGGLSRAKV
jgi:hypothetical protein